MRVEPELPDHPKFLRLKKIIGEGAMEYLIRLWSHCQGNQRGEYWPSADADYVEMICRWDGQPGVLFKALAECGRPGFVAAEENGVRIHDWEEMNSQTVNNWRRNLNGRAAGNPPGSQREPTGTPRNSQRGKPGQQGGSKPKAAEPNENPRVPPTGTPTGSQGEPSALSVSPSLFPSSGGSTESHGQPTGSRQGAPMVQDDYELARGLVGTLNDLTGSQFDPPIQELDVIVGRVLEVNRDFAGVEKMVRRQVALWKDDAKARHWLKPGTLFGPNFHDYYGQREMPVRGSVKNGRPRGEILQQLTTARDQKAPAEEIEALQRELEAAA
jgi:hypothetical protein